MNQTLCMKRETLFKTESLQLLRDDALQMYTQWRSFKNQLEQNNIQLLQMLHAKTKKLYEQNQLQEIKAFLNVKKTLKKHRNIPQKIVNNLNDKQIQVQCRTYNEIFELVESITKKVEQAFSVKVNRYKPFLNQIKFQQALFITAFDAYAQLTNPEITKESINRARYRFIQRATVKTSPLSYLGKTTYLSNHPAEIEQIKLNNVVKYLLLMASLHNENLDQVLQITVRPPIKKCNGVEAIYYEKNYLLKDIDWVLKQDDLLHQKDIVKFMLSIQHCKNPAQVKKHVTRHPFLTYELLINNGLVIPDFNFYYSNDNSFYVFLQKIFTDSEQALFYPPSIQEVNYEKLEDLLIGYIEQYSSDYYGQSFEEKLQELPLFYHDNIALENFNIPKIDKKFLQNIFDNYIIVNRQCYMLHQLLIANKKIYDGQTVLSLLIDLHEKLQYKKSKMPINPRPFRTTMKKNALLYLQQEKDNSLILNNLNIGGGSVFHRYGHLFDDNIKTNLKTYYNNLFTSSYPIYELVIDEEISNHMDVGKSIFPKLRWPDNFSDVTLQITDDDITFMRAGKPIQLIYVGTVPYHLFTGIKSHLLHLIHPWTIDVENLERLNGRRCTKLNWSSICTTDKISDTTFYYAITEYFTKQQLPFEFFIKKKWVNFKVRKPIWISLYSVESVKVLKHLLLEEQSIEIEEVKPKLSGDRVEEFCILTTEGAL